MTSCKKQNAVKEVIDKTVLKRWFKNVKIQNSELRLLNSHSTLKKVNLENLINLTWVSLCKKDEATSHQRTSDVGCTTKMRENVQYVLS